MCVSVSAFTSLNFPFIGNKFEPCVLSIMQYYVSFQRQLAANTTANNGVIECYLDSSAAVSTKIPWISFASRSVCPPCFKNAEIIAAVFCSLARSKK